MSSSTETLVDHFRQIEERLGTLNRVLGTRAAIAQTPKQLIWTLNKAKLYRYTPVVPEEKRHRIPLLLVFALMNRPYIFDLRPGHSFVEFMLQHGYDQLDTLDTTPGEGISLSTNPVFSRSEGLSNFSTKKKKESKKIDSFSMILQYFAPIK